MNAYCTHLSFHKLEQFNIHTSSLATFVLIRNSLVSELARQQQARQTMIESESESDDELYYYSDSEEDEEEEEEIWFDHCIDALEEEEEDMTPKDTKPIFYLHEEEEEEDEDEDEEDTLMYFSQPVKYTSFPEFIDSTFPFQFVAL